MTSDPRSAHTALDAADRARLIALYDVIAPQLPAIADQLCRKAWLGPAEPAELAPLAGPALAELRAALVDWLAAGLRGPGDTASNERRAWLVRRLPPGIARPRLVAAIAALRMAYLDVIAERLAAGEAIACARSMTRLLDLELDLMLRHCERDDAERLAQREREIQADRISALQTMSAGLAHEVRNPLNAAALQLELLERRLRRAGDLKMIEPISLAHHEIRRLAELLNEFLSFARPSELHLEDHDAVAIVRHVLELEGPLALRSNTIVRLDTAPPSAVAAVDPDKLHQIVQNLVRNAVEATARDGHVTVSVALDDTALRLCVGDDGPGIPAAIRSRIYEPFFSTKQDGTGMGMSIVHNFVVMHGGRIDIDTGPRGTQIDVVIPRARR